MTQLLVVITGASSGIGLGAGRAFMAAGYPLLLISRHIEPIAGIADKPVLYGQVDVADYNALQHAIFEAELRFGGTDCVINRAGLADARPFEQVDPASYNCEIDTNLRGVLNGIKVALAGMVDRQKGAVINISSVSDRETSPVAIGYTATKYAVRALTESLREAEGKNGVRVINIAPGYVKTNIHRNMGITFEQYCEALGNPDFMTADELAEIILYCYHLLVLLPPTRAFVHSRSRCNTDPNYILTKRIPSCH
jgi:NADP-dependent 3-hydroxy acid dehydrogenase YdfG